MNGALWSPGAVDTKQLNAAEREAARVALNEHVEQLTLKHNALTSAVAQLIAWQGQHSEEALDLAATIGTNVQIAAILDRLTALDSHEDRIDMLERMVASHGLRIAELEYLAVRTVWQRIRAVFAR